MMTAKRLEIEIAISRNRAVGIINKKSSDLHLNWQ